jgi:hypothetical protein
MKESRAASTSTRRRTASHAHEQASDGQEEESDNLPNNDEVARAHGMVMSTDIHRRPDGEVISNNTRLEKSVSWLEAGEARRRHHRQNDILLTSDSGIDGTDFPFEISCKIYCNSKKIPEPKPVGRFLRRNWDLGLVESYINNAIEAELKDFGDYNLKRRSVIIRSANGRGRVTRYDIDDFSFENLEKINESCDHVYHAAKCQFVNVSFEVKIEYDAKAFRKPRQKRIAIHLSRFRHLLRHCRNLHGIEKEKLRGNLMPGSSDLSVRGTLSIALLQSGDMNIALVSLEPAGLILLLRSIILSILLSRGPGRMIVKPVEHPM